LITRNNAATGSLPRNTLYKRLNTGVWEKFKVNSTSDHNWKTAALAIDPNPSGGILYVMGVDLTSQLAEYKICPLGSEASLETAPVSGLFSGGTFDDLSVPAANLNATTGLMVTVDNTAANDIWYRHLPISGSVPVSIGAVALSGNEVNTNAQYTIPLTLSDNGALAASSGKINVVFPNNTFVPGNMIAGNVLIDGTPASEIIVNNTTRLVSITTPVNLPDNHVVSVVFNQAAGLLNPTPVDTNYKLTVWTSTQTSQVESPTYSLLPATTTVTAGTVQPFPTDVDSMADYTLNFNLGNHGRLISGTSTIKVQFGAATGVKNGAFSGTKVNNASATAIGDSVLRKITVTTPASVSLMNNAAVTLFLPKSAVYNPAVAGNYTLTVATSVETTAVASNPYIIEPNNAIGVPIAGTTKNFDRNNQSKMFYHDGVWWVVAQAKADQQWYLWKFDGINWSQHLLIHSSAKSRPDCILLPSINQAYILLPGSGTTYITRLNYSGSAWTIDSGYPYTIANFAQSSDRGINLVRASNGDLWVFMLTDSTLLAKYSTNAGQTWSSTITIKDHLHHSTGLTDAVTFSYNGQNHIGVGYAENSSAGSVFGFLLHQDGDADTAWTDETANIPQFSGTSSDDHISMTVHNNKILMIVKTNGGGGSIVNIGLFVRETNAVWSQYPIFFSGGWTRPTLAVDQTNNVLYVFGTRESGVKVGEMKKCAVGNYAALQAAPIDTIFKHNADNFSDMSVAAHTVTSAMNLLVCQGNQTRDEVWYNLIVLGSLAKPGNAQADALKQANDENFEGVQVYPNPFNPTTSFRFKVNTAGPVKLQIFNLNGQLVKTLVDGELLPGVHQKQWSGRNQNGYTVASGVYWYRLQIGPKVWNGQIQLLK
jgi:FlgD Ig-like domain